MWVSLGLEKFDQDKIRNALTQMIIIDELPFTFVEGGGFKIFMAVVGSRFKISSRWTISRDCYSLFVAERSKLKMFLKNMLKRVCLTTDSLTFI